MYHPKVVQLSNSFDNLLDASHTPLRAGGRRRRLSSFRLSTQVRTSGRVNNCFELNTFVPGVFFGQVMSNTKMISQFGYERARAFPKVLSHLQFIPLPRTSGEEFHCQVFACDGV